MNMSSAVGDSREISALVRKGGIEITLVKWQMFDVASFAACRLSLLLIALIVSQLGASTSLIFRIEAGLNLKEISTFSASEESEVVDCGI